jgi:acyl-coenzyme A synthetase/AMP-(fatty) acid ligase
MFTIGDVTLYGFTISHQVLLAGGAIARKVQKMRENLSVASRYSVNKMIATPIALERMMDVMDSDGVRLPSLKQISITGSLFHAGLIERMERMFSAEIVVAYGSSEAGGISRGAVTSAKYRAGYVGELMPGVKLVSSGTPDNPGPLTILNDRERVASYYSRGQVIPDNQPFYALPDLGYVDGGSLYLVGRDDEVYNVSGNKIAFSRIESVVRGVPGVRDAAVCSGSGLGDPIALMIAVVVEGAFDPRAIAAPVVTMSRLPRIESHLKVFPVNEIPRNDMGKVDRQGVMRAYSALTGAPGVSPASDFPETVGSA